MAFSATPMIEGDPDTGFAGKYAKGSIFTCDLQAFLIQMAVSEIFWMGCLCTHYHLRIVEGWSEQKADKFKWLYVFVSFVLPLGAAISAFFPSEGNPFEATSGLYGPATLWCWIRGRHDIERFA